MAFFDRLIEDGQYKNIGKVTCLAVTGKSKFLAFGTQNMFIAGYFVKIDAFRYLKLKGKTSVTAITIHKNGEHLLAGSVRGDVFLIKVKEDTLENLKKFDSITERTILKLAFVNYYLGFTVLDIGQNSYYIKPKQANMQLKFISRDVALGSSTSKYTSIVPIELYDIEGGLTDNRVLCMTGYNKVMII